MDQQPDELLIRLDEQIKSIKEDVMAIRSKINGTDFEIVKSVCLEHPTYKERVDNLMKWFWLVAGMSLSALGGAVFVFLRR